MKFKKTRKAMSELNASKNSMKFIQDNKNPSIAGLRGIAFADGGDVSPDGSSSLNSSVPYALQDDTTVDNPPPQQDVDGFLNTIRQVESSGGKNYNHQMIQHGLQAGQQGIGQYGLLPNTVKQVVRSAVNAHDVTPEMTIVGQMNDPQQIKKSLEKYPDVEDQFARRLANQLLNRFGGDQEKAAYSWNQGSNLSDEDLQGRDYKNSDYVNKFRKLKQMLQSSVDEP